VGVLRGLVTVNYTFYDLGREVLKKYSDNFRHFSRF